ncbi:MAG: phenazine biosynthesis protein PhzF family [Herbinix sp.]|jgi:PhzF family phenazine biosynthesis protein|nr:phenazine biosynthesis protein PhzF family [Herbinix sp.]
MIKYIEGNDKMKQVKAYYYEAFADLRGKGNPAGVVFDANELTEDEMQVIAMKIGFNETVFLLDSAKADVRLRYFTPGHEMNLCGHGTIASIFGLMERSKTMVSRDITVDTLAGILPVHYDHNLQEVHMAQAPAEFIDFTGNVERLAASIGITAEDIDNNYPIVYGSTGIWTLIVPIKTIDTFLRMHPDNKQFPDILAQLPTASVHPICLETYDKTCDMHGRHFSSPRSGTVEDPVTGTASGVMGAYYINYINRCTRAELKVEQGYEIGRKGVVRVFVSENEDKIDVSISGKAVFVEEFIITI